MQQPLFQRAKRECGAAVEGSYVASEPKVNAWKLFTEQKNSFWKTLRWKAATSSLRKQLY